MFSDLSLRLQRGLPEYQFEGPVKPAVAQAESILSGLGNNRPPEPATEGGLRGFFSKATKPGGFFERLGTFGAELQDIDDGGNRADRRQQGMRQRQNDVLAQQQAQDAAQVRQQIQQMAQGLGLSGVDQLRFNVDPEGYLKDRWQAEQPDDPTILNTRRGVLSVQDGQKTWIEQFPDEPEDVEFGWIRKPDGTLAYEPGGPADPSYISRTAGARRAPPRSSVSVRNPARSGGGSSAPSAAIAPPWKRSW